MRHRIGCSLPQKREVLLAFSLAFSSSRFLFAMVCCCTYSIFIGAAALFIAKQRPFGRSALYDSYQSASEIDRVMNATVEPKAADRVIHMG